MAQQHGKRRQHSPEFKARVALAAATEKDPGGVGRRVRSAPDFHLGLEERADQQRGAALRQGEAAGRRPPQ
jgi:hypothetical protein